jgi:hypothetical protein
VKTAAAVLVAIVTYAIVGRWLGGTVAAAIAIVSTLVLLFLARAVRREQRGAEASVAPVWVFFYAGVALALAAAWALLTYDPRLIAALEQRENLWIVFGLSPVAIAFLMYLAFLFATVMGLIFVGAKSVRSWADDSPESGAFGRLLVGSVNRLASWFERS